MRYATWLLGSATLFTMSALRRGQAGADRSSRRGAGTCLLALVQSYTGNAQRHFSVRARFRY